jgi:hypothetical protein
MTPKSFLRRFVALGWLDRALPLVFAVSLVVMCFVVGAYVAEFDVPLYKRVLEPSFRGIKAITEQREMMTDKKSSDWDRARSDQTGVTTYRPDLAYEGLTMYVSFGESPSANLISMSGEIVHRWELPFREIWPDPPHVKKPSPEKRIHWHTARMFPNGDLIANYVSAGGNPYGYGIAKMDKDSKLIWRYSDNAHHDFDVDDAGRVYALRHSIRDDEIDGAPQLSTPILEDFVVALSPEGEETQRISLYEAFAKSEFRHYLQSIESDRRGDHTHSNGVAVITAAFAAKHDFCSPGDLLISVRNPGWLAILNLEREEIVWATCGVWRRQHDPDVLENGNILLFDNQGNRGFGGKTRILEWNPTNGGVEWCYTGTENQVFESGSRGCQQLLPNGNVLITESNNGRLLEVTREQQVVWEFNNPHRDKATNEYVAVVCSAQRYAADELTFLASTRVAKSRAKSTGASNASKIENAWE